MACEVAARIWLPVACLLQQLRHTLMLLPAMFKQQPPACLEVRRRAGDDVADVVKPIVMRAAAHQRMARLVLERGQVFVIRREVGRVADDEVKGRCLLRQGIKPVAAVPLHRQPQLLAVGLGCLQGCGAGICGKNGSVGALVLQRQRDGAAAGAKVQNAWRFCIAQQL